MARFCLNQGLLFISACVCLIIFRLDAGQDGKAVKFSFPALTIVQKNTPSFDYLMLGVSQGMTSYLVIVDNNLTPVFGKRVERVVYDFSLQGNGTLSYNLYPDEFYALDSSGNRLKRYIFPANTTPDVHDIKVLPDGSYYVIGKEKFITDMSKYIAHGDTAAEIVANSVYYMDPDGKTLWSWKTADNYEILDCDDHVNLLEHTIDWTHMNSIALAPDGNILVSIRNFNEIAKINRITGRVMWHLGGKHNSFSFIDDNRRFSRQHDVHSLPNGNLLIFDNGNFLTPSYSSVVEYKLDELNKTATMVSRYSHEGNIFTRTMGGAQRLSNGNTLICWGENQEPCITEIDSTGAVELELKFNEPTYEYRARKFPWRTNYFYINRRFMKFDSLLTGSVATQSITLSNPHTYPVLINNVEFQSNTFSLGTPLPITIEPKGSVSLSMIFAPRETGHYLDKMTIGFSSDTFLLAQQMILAGVAYDKPSSISDQKTIEIMDFTLGQNYPNPFNPVTSIEYYLPASGWTSLKVYDVHGREVAVISDSYQTAGKHEVSFDAARLSSGVYFYRLSSAAKVLTRRMCLIK